MCVAWIIIKFHEIRMNRAALALVTQQLASGGPEAVAASKDLAAAINSAKGQLASSKGFVQRFFSLKAAHGIIMFVSWINIAGRWRVYVVGRVFMEGWLLGCRSNLHAINPRHLLVALAVASQWLGGSVALFCRGLVGWCGALSQPLPC